MYLVFGIWGLGFMMYWVVGIEGLGRFKKLFGFGWSGGLGV